MQGFVGKWAKIPGGLPGSSYQERAPFLWKGPSESRGTEVGMRLCWPEGEEIRTEALGEHFEAVSESKI